MSAPIIPPVEVPFDPSRQSKVDHAGRIDKLDFQIVIGVFTGLACIVSLLRFALRLKLRHKLFFDDYLVLVGLAALVSAMGALYHLMSDLYIIIAVNVDPTVLFSLPELMQLMDSHKWFTIYLSLIWTAIFAIKFSFLVFFKTLIRNISRKLDYYYLFVMIFTGVSWAFMVAEPFILCPWFGAQTVKCYPNSEYKLNLGLTSLVTVMDIATDAMVVSIPIIVLRMSGLKRNQKLGIAVFLCLSIAMIVIALIRIIGSIHPTLRAERDFDTQWSIFWQHMEGCIAVLMGSITAFRGIFAGHVSEKQTSTQNTTSSSALRRLKGWLRISSKKSKEHSAQTRDSARPPVLAEDSITRGTLTGVKTFIRRYKRDPGNTTVASLDTNGSIYDPLQDYHNFQREQGAQDDGLRLWNTASDKTSGSQADSFDEKSIV